MDVDTAAAPRAAEIDDVIPSADEDPRERILASLARSFVGAALEVIEGRRLLRQLEGMTSTRVLEKIAARAALHSALEDQTPAARSLRRSGHVTQAVHLGRTLVCPVAAQAWEIVVLCTEARRTRVCALKIIRRRNRWIVADLEMG